VALLPSLPLHQTPTLRERHLGDVQGFTDSEAKKVRAEAFACMRSGQRIPGGGESAEDLKGRMLAAVAEIARRHPGGRVGAISHGENHSLHLVLHYFIL
jgi:broad specificity phosphatase PhoE